MSPSAGQRPGAEYFAGFITEKALSVDNLFVFLVIMTSFGVPREDQQKVLLFGIAFALLARTVFILLGAALISIFAWVFYFFVFYFFGLILLITAGNMLRPEGTDEKSADNIMIRTAQRLFHTTDYYDGDKLFTVQEGKRALTPMLLVMVASLFPELPRHPARTVHDQLEGASGPRLQGFSKVRWES